MILRRRITFAAVLYVAAAITLSGVRPLWLDEILQLLQTRGTTPSEMLIRLRSEAGAAPLGYLTQQLSLKLTKYSVRRARLPSSIFSGAALMVTVLLASELGISSFLAGLAFAVLPLAVRYATESRIYSEALFFSVLATLICVKFASRPGWKLAVTYFLAILAAAYTQPYSASVALAHVVWAVAMKERKPAYLGGGALALAVLAFLPWYLRSLPHAVATMGSTSPHFSATWATPLMLIRELAGGGYWVSCPLVILCIASVVRSSLPTRTTTLLVLLIVIPVASILTADAVFDYFLAARQFLWILPPAALLAISNAQRERYESVLLVTFLVVCVAQSIRFFHSSSENWQAAADAIEARTSQGACLSIEPASLYSTYLFFRPDLAHLPCDPSRIVLGLSSYSTSQNRDSAVQKLTRLSYQIENQAVVGGTTVITFYKTSNSTKPSAAVR